MLAVDLITLFNEFLQIYTNIGQIFLISIPCRKNSALILLAIVQCFFLVNPIDIGMSRRLDKVVLLGRIEAACLEIFGIQTLQTLLWSCCHGCVRSGGRVGNFASCPRPARLVEFVSVFVGLRFGKDVAKLYSRFVIAKERRIFLFNVRIWIFLVLLNDSKEGLWETCCF